MSLTVKFLFVLTSTALGSYATTLSFIGPTTVTGLPCAASDPQCVIGGAGYAIYGAQLTQPTSGNPLWTLTIETNYPSLITGQTIPTAQWGADLLNYSTADFMIGWKGTAYGIVLAQHIKANNTVDGYVTGNLYQAPNVTPNFVPSGTNTTIVGTIGILPDSPRPNFPIWLAPGGVLLGTGTVTVANTGNGTPAQYTITDTFSAPAGFLADDNFTISAASWACANGIITGGGTFVPEPSTLFVVAPFLLLVPFLIRRRRGTQAGAPESRNTFSKVF